MFVELFFPFLAGRGQGLEERARFHDLRHHVLEQLLPLFVRDFDFVHDFIEENDKGCARGLHELLAIFLGYLRPGCLGLQDRERHHGQNHQFETEPVFALHRLPSIGVEFGWCEASKAAGPTHVGLTIGFGPVGSRPRAPARPRSGTGSAGNGYRSSIPVAARSRL